MGNLLDTNIVSNLVRNPHGRVTDRIKAVGELCLALLIPCPSIPQPTRGPIGVTLLRRSKEGQVGGARYTRDMQPITDARLMGASTSDAITHR